MNKATSNADLMQAPVTCPLCSHSAHDLISTLRYDDIRYVYRKLYQLEISPEQTELLEYLRCRNCDLRFFYPAVCGDALFYERLQKFPWYYLADKSEFQIARSVAPITGSVLEIGCGVGKFSAFLPSACSYRGLEFNEEAVEIARRSGLQVERVTVEELAERETTMFDMVCCFQVLEHVPSPGSLLSAMTKLLAPGGALVISVPSEDSFMSDEINNVFNTPPHHVTRWSDAALKNIERVTGLELVRLEHEPLSAMHEPAFAKAMMLRFIRQHLGLHFQIVSRLAASFPVRSVLYLLSRLLIPGIRANHRFIPGHSVIAVYKKPAIVAN